MVSIAVLKLHLEGKDNVSATLKSAGDSAEGLGSKLGRVGEVMSGFLAAGAVTAGVSKVKDFFGGAIAAASELEQTIGGVQSVFGDSSSEILKFGESAASAVGLSKNSFNQLAAPLGAMLKSAGFGMDEVTDKTLGLTQKAADLAATFGGPVDDAMNAIASLMRGESNPIERYGVSIKQADVNLRALADSGKKSEKELTAQELAAARLAILFDQTAASTGQFAREADTAAGKAERLKAKQENLSAQMGAHLLPLQMRWTELQTQAVSVLATKLVPLLESKVVPAVQKVSGALKEFTESEVVPRVKQVADVFAELAPRALEVGRAIAEGIGGRLIADATAAWQNILVPAFAFAADLFERMQPTVVKLATGLGELGATVAQKLGPPLTRILEFVADNHGVLAGLATLIAAVAVRHLDIHFKIA